jgi:hypothetical protein
MMAIFSVEAEHTTTSRGVGLKAMILNPWLAWEFVVAMVT